jgi:hypothetical protein
MNLEAIEQRERELRALQTECQQNLRDAEQKRMDAIQNLHKISGAIDDCTFWKSQVAQASGQDIEIRMDANGTWEIQPERA